MIARFSFAVLKPAFVPIAMVLAFPLALAGVSRPPSSSRLVATLFPPWWSEARSIDAAGQVGPIAAVGALPFVLVVALDTPESIQKLRRAGAWLVFDSRLIAICGASNKGGPQT